MMLPAFLLNLFRIFFHFFHAVVSQLAMHCVGSKLCKPRLSYLLLVDAGLDLDLLLSLRFKLLKTFKIVFILFVNVSAEKLAF
jgi:hypothetical protein